MKILLIGDIVGKGARKAVCKLVPELRKEFNCCFCIANGENIAGGSGLTHKCVESLNHAGVDVVTSGDHIWRQKEFIQDIHRLPYVLRPANFHADQPGKGFGVFNIPIGGVICVISLLGRVFLQHHGDNPFTAVEQILGKVNHQAKIIFVDFHGEATSEKVAMGRFLDGRVTAVFGTHTHVQTADEQIFPGGTAYISDIGMVGGRDSIIGRDIGAVLKSFTVGMPSHYKVVEKNIMLHGAVVEFNPEDGTAIGIERIKREFE
jgi:metallophosphoesterase (TIGR00282 family)